MQKLKIIFFFNLILTLITIQVQAVPTVPTVSSGIAPALNLRLFSDQGSFLLYSELAATSDTDQRTEKNFTLGTYYKLLPGIKIGAFYSREYGLRHYADWAPTNGVWSWTQTNARAEDFFIFDMTPRVQLNFLPTENWVAELKARYEFNAFNHEQTLMLRPGLTYFWLREDEPFINFFLQYEADIALNYGVQTVAERWLYLGGLYHVCNSVDLGAYAALKWQNWGSPPAYIAKGVLPYNVGAESTVIGLLAILHLPPGP